MINEGKLAVVEGIEVSHIFNCGEFLGTSQCSQSQVDAGLAEVKKLGVSIFFPIHKFDNAFGGTKMDGGETGVIVNQGNHLETSHYWDIQHCTGPEHDSQQVTLLPAGGLAKMERKSIIPVLGGLPPLPVGLPGLPTAGGGGAAGLPAAPALQHPRAHVDRQLPARRDD